MKKYLILFLLITSFINGQQTRTTYDKYILKNVPAYVPGSSTNNALRTLHIDKWGNLVQTPIYTYTAPYKIYRARIVQTGTTIPFITVLENTTGVNPDLAYIAPGIYTIRFSTNDAIGVDKVLVSFTPSSDVACPYVSIFQMSPDTRRFVFNVKAGCTQGGNTVGTLYNNLLYGYVEFKIYP